MNCKYGAKKDGNYIQCRNRLVNAPVTPGVCMKHCDYYDGPERTPELIEATIGMRPPSKPKKRKPKKQKPPLAANCRHRGKPLDLIPAPVCGGKIPTHECALHGKCLIQHRCKGWSPPQPIRVCSECKDREPREKKKKEPDEPSPPRPYGRDKRVVDPIPRTLYRREANGFAPAQLEGMWRGAIFLICGGPSLAFADLSVLDKRGIVTMTINNAWAVYRPNMAVMNDMPHRFLDTGWLDPGVMKFTPVCRSKNRIGTNDEQGLRTLTTRVSGCPSVWYFVRSAKDTDRFWQSPYAQWNCSKTKSTMMTSFWLSKYLGFERIYLIGADFHATANKRYGFAEKIDTTRAKQNNRIFQAMNRRIPKLLAEPDAPEIVCCTPGSRITEAIPRMDLVEAVERESSYCERKVSTFGMYTRAKSRKAEKPTRYICLATPGMYVDAAEVLKQSAAKIGLDLEIIPYQSEGGWPSNALAKVRRLNEIVKQSDRDILCIDADAVIHQDPQQVLDKMGSFAVYHDDRAKEWHNDYRAGTIFVRADDEGRRMMQKWADSIQPGDRKNQQPLYRAMQGESFAPLPLGMCWIPGLRCDTVRTPKSIYISHHRASRKKSGCMKGQREWMRDGRTAMISSR